jgi:hypothetical protein
VLLPGDEGRVSNVAEADVFSVAARAAVAGQKAGVRRRMMSLFGADALVCYRLDSREHARRRRAGVRDVSSADVLELMLGLPVGMPVPIASLTGRELAALRSVPPGVVSIRTGQVVRQAVAPVAVDLAVVAARSWRSGLDAAGRFTPFCARAMVLARRPTDIRQMCIEAEFYGVGVVVVDGGGAELLVEPVPFQRVRFTAASWRFLEDVYRYGR